MKSTPWGVNRLGHMISSNVQTQIHGHTWVKSVPEPYRKNLRESVRAAWWVLTGKAEAVVWPVPGELEHSLSGGFEAGKQKESLK